MIRMRLEEFLTTKRGAKPSQPCIESLAERNLYFCVKDEIDVWFKEMNVNYCASKEHAASRAM